MAGERLGTALRQIGQLFAEGVLSGLSDAQLLDRFVEHRDQSAFEALVARHGPMVLSVCRGILRDPNDAEDAFQAAFLVMVKKAKTVRARHSLRGWLYQVAHRIAIQANIAAGRRRAHEREAGQMASTTTSTGLTLADALLPALHEEIARLPEKFRLAVVLCDLDGCRRRRPPQSWAGASGRCADGWPRRAIDSRSGWVVAAQCPTTRPWRRSSSGRAASRCRPPCNTRPFARPSSPSTRSSPRGRPRPRPTHSLTRC